MDWIERWLGLNPDGGDGSVERVLVGAVIVVAVAVVSVAVPRVRASLRQRYQHLVAGRRRLPRA